MERKIVKGIVALLLVSTLLIGNACAEMIMPCADEVFSSAAAYLYSNKYLKISCVTDDPHNIRITNCWYEIKLNGDWEYGGGITVSPSSVSNGMILGAQVNCSSYFSTGTYRVGFTVDADGHSISRYSNERTY